MGWLGWAPEVAWAADVNMIEIALASRTDLLGMIFGTGKGETGKPRKMTAGTFRKLAKRINAKFKGGSDG